MIEQKQDKLKQYTPVILLCAAFLLVGFFALNDLSLYTPDSTRYLIWAKSLGNFEGFRDGTSPEPQQYVIHAPLYALLLSPIGKLFPLSVVAAKVWTMCFGTGLLLLFYFWISKPYGKGTALAGAFLLAFNPLFLLYSTEVLSDIPFALTIIAFFYFIDKEQDAIVKRSNLILLSLLVACGMLVRELGVALMISALVYLLLKKEFRKALIVFEISIVIYLAWHVRNEWFVARKELPSLTNSGMYLHHYFTSSGASFFSELAARIATNMQIYGRSIGKILFYPLYGDYFYDVVYRDSAIVTTMWHLSQYAFFPMVFLIAAVCSLGVYRDGKNSTTAHLKWVFVVVYLLIVFCYPINDIRFLMPLLLLMIYYFVIGGGGLKNMMGRNLSKGLALAIPLVLVLVSIPNLVWCSEYLSANRSYRSFFDEKNIDADTLRAGGHFAKPFPLAGEWFRKNTDSTSCILTQWKDIACYVGDRKVLNVNETIPTADFEHYLRDYGVGYIVSLAQANGMVEFDYQMRSCRRFSFDPVKKFGMVEVFAVRKVPYHAEFFSGTTQMTRGFDALNQGKFDDAEQHFRSARELDALNFAAMFYHGVAMEFDGKLESADSLFWSFRFLQQSGMYLELSATHRDLIEGLRQAAAAEEPHEKAIRYAVLGTNYWVSGFPTFAHVMLQKSLAADPNCVAGLIFSTMFLVDEGDIEGARAFFIRAAKTNELKGPTVNFGDYFSAYDAVKTAKTPEDVSKYTLDMAVALTNAKYQEGAINVLLEFLEKYPGNREAKLMLTDLYKEKHRLAPAKKELMNVLTINPNDPVAKKKLEEVEELMD